MRRDIRIIIMYVYRAFRSRPLDDGLQSLPPMTRHEASPHFRSDCWNQHEGDEIICKSD
jgi:hypothetical protein